jgi:small subunit ribosomal protein S17
MADEERTQDEEQPQDAAEEQAPESEEAPAEEQGPEEAAGEEQAPEADEAAATEEAPADEPADQAGADGDAEAPAAEEASAEEPAADDDEGLDWKARRRLERSRQPAEAGPQLSPEERQAAREERRRAGATVRRRHRQARRAKKGERRSGTPPAERRPNPTKVRQGIVVSDSADKTITVRIDIARRHPAYEKIVRRSRTLRAHDEGNEAGRGDVVRVVETRPISRSKRWRLVEIVEKAR